MKKETLKFCKGFLTGISLCWLILLIVASWYHFEGNWKGILLGILLGLPWLFIIIEEHFN